MEKDKDSSNPLIENDDEQVPLDLADGADGTLEHQTRQPTRPAASRGAGAGRSTAHRGRNSSFGITSSENLPSSPELRTKRPQELLQTIKALKRSLRQYEVRDGPASEQSSASSMEANAKATQYAMRVSQLEGELSRAKSALAKHGLGRTGVVELDGGAGAGAREATASAAQMAAEATAKDASSRAAAAEERAAKAEVDKAAAEAALEEAGVRAADAESGRLALQAEVDSISAQLLEARALLEEVREQLQGAEDRARESQVAMEDAQAEAKVEIGAAQQEAKRYRERFETSDSRRAALEEKVLDLQGAIRVFVRVRPTSPSEAGKEQAGMAQHMAKLRRVASGKQVKQAASRKGAAGSADGAEDGSESGAGSPLFEFPAVDGEPTRLVVAERPGLGTGGYGVSEGKRHSFDFQRVFSPLEGQRDVFEEVKGLVHSAVDGHRVCVFAYGQTGAGKTYTMMGPDGGRGGGVKSGSMSAGDRSQGIIPRAVQEIFSRAEGMEKLGWNVQVRADVCEIYNEKLRDLAPASVGDMDGIEVVDIPTKVSSRGGGGGGVGGASGTGGRTSAGSRGKSAGSAGGRRQSKAPSASSMSASGRTSGGGGGSANDVQLRLDPRSNTSEVHGLRQVEAENAESLLEMLDAAMASRATKGTQSNATSSRSHAVFRVFVQSEHRATKQVRYGVLNLVDLAGSERVSKSGADKEASLMKEASSINASLTVLGQVMRTLAESSKAHAQFRGSVLTRMLQSSLTDGAKALMICNLCPLHLHSQETLCSLRFAVSVSEATTRR